MDYLYKTTTKYTLEEYKKFNNAVLIKKHMVLGLVCCLILLFLCGIILENNFVIVFALLYPFLFLIIKSVSVKRNFESNKIAKNIVVTFEFYQEYFVEKHEVGEAKIPYDKLSDIIETKTNYYLMIAKNQGYMISKQNMPEGLNEFIQKDVKEKIKRK